MSVSITSSAQFEKILSSSSVVIVDFYADWCSPCKAIYPTYQSLAIKYTRPNKITFVKVNVETSPEISQRYGVTAMPTFMLFKSGSVTKTIRGADPRQLTNAVETAVAQAGPAAPMYSSVGRTLGDTSRPKTTPASPFIKLGSVDTIIRFFALYFITLFAIDSYGAGERSSFNVNTALKRSVHSSGIRPARVGTQAGKKLGTIADLGGS
ncbi:thioredoxin [Blumeria hordei DH14]|uniref:Thioredoxin n=1 Tax=Blumeria graminis f. sp. hordei (strain DH14) TaxID=546991 RepID=N1JHN9_BLUG1|nr:thioredoxin [Blumeria hordei DH14]